MVIIRDGADPVPVRQLVQGDQVWVAIAQKVRGPGFLDGDCSNTHSYLVSMNIFQRGEAEKSGGPGEWGSCWWA